MGDNNTQPVDLELRATSGPTAIALRLQRPGPLTMGRRSVHALQLNDPAISRDHATLTYCAAQGARETAEGEWLIHDMGSTHRTWLNGVALKPHRQYHLRTGDLIVVGPWTLLVADRSGLAEPETALATLSNTPSGTAVFPLEAPRDGTMTLRELQLLQTCSERIYQADSERAIIEAVLEAGVEGTGFTCASYLRPMGDKDRVDVVASRGPQSQDQPIRTVSRALLGEAASGRPALLKRGSHGVEGDSGKANQAIQTALCAPILVGSTLAAFIYFDCAAPPTDRRHGEDSTMSYPLGLARLAALGIANLMRIDVDKRRVRAESKLHAAADAQRWLLPAREGRVGGFTYSGETRQGRHIGGDFFDIIALSDTRLAIVVGDVRGRGLPASVLVNASQGYLHACLVECADPALAVSSLNRFYHSRIARARTLKLWVGVLDAASKTMTFVDAGHGGGRVLDPDGRCTLLGEQEHPPVGVTLAADYKARTIPFPPDLRILVLSDGFVKQRAQDIEGDHADDSPISGQDKPPQRFGFDRVQACLQSSPQGADEISVLFAALERHAGTNVFDDDATAVIIRP